MRDERRAHPERLSFTVLTPQRELVRAQVRGLRVSAADGWLGIRPRGEACIVAVQPGLLLVYGDSVHPRLHPRLHPRYGATAGGLLRSDGRTCTLYTPYAVFGATPAETQEALSAVLHGESPEFAARRELDALQTRILRELRDPQLHIGGSYPGEG